METPAAPLPASNVPAQQGGALPAPDPGPPPTRAATAAPAPAAESAAAVPAPAAAAPAPASESASTTAAPAASWLPSDAALEAMSTTQLRKFMARCGVGRGPQDRKEDYIEKLKARAAGTPYVNKPNPYQRRTEAPGAPAQVSPAPAVPVPALTRRRAPAQVSPTRPSPAGRIEDGFGTSSGAPLPPPPALVDSALPPPAAPPLLTNADGMTPASLLQARIDEAICTEGIPNCFTSTSGADMRQFVVSATDGIKCSICCNNAWSSRTPLVTLLHDLKKHCGQYATRSLPETQAHLRRLRLHVGAPMVAGDSSSLDVPPAWTDAAAALAATAAPDPSRLVFSPTRGPSVAPALAPAAWATAAPLPAQSPKKRAPPTAPADEHEPLQERVEKKPRAGRCSPS